MSTVRLLHNRRGAAGAEFALILPLLILLLFGIIDVGRWMYIYNRADKATQMGVRMAVVVDTPAAGLSSSYLGVGGLTQGDSIPASAFGKVTCTSTGCVCTTSPCPTLGLITPANFTRVADRVRAILGRGLATNANVTIEYSSSGIGYAGNPNGPDLAPLVTVKLSNVQFRPMIALSLRSMTMPDFHASLTFEDGTGAQSN